MSVDVAFNTGPDGLELTELRWLLDHHETKQHERRQLVDDLYLTPGDVVLDLGCGPGLWSPLFAEKVKPDGRIIGVDISVELLAYAEKQRQHNPLKDLMSFRQADFSAIPLDDDRVDFVFFGGCFTYVEDHLRILEEQKRVTRKGGRIAAKDFDGADFILHPIDPTLTLKVLLGASRARDRSEKYFDNFAGRKTHGSFLKAGLKDVWTKSYAIQKLAPLTPAAKRYIAGNSEWHARMAEPYLSVEDYAQWRAHFDPASDEYILDRDELYFSMLEVLTVGTV
ncbi:MAG: methyltransferase domain-containing protein [Acidiferrobacterales bacterium]